MKQNIQINPCHSTILSCRPSRRRRNGNPKIWGTYSVTYSTSTLPHVHAHTREKNNPPRCLQICGRSLRIHTNIGLCTISQQAAAGCAQHRRRDPHYIYLVWIILGGLLSPGRTAQYTPTPHLWEQIFTPPGLSRRHWLTSALLPSLVVHSTRRLTVLQRQTSNSQ